MTRLDTRPCAYPGCQQPETAMIHWRNAKVGHRFLSAPEICAFSCKGVPCTKSSNATSPWCDVHDQLLARYEAKPTCGHDDCPADFCGVEVAEEVIREEKALRARDELIARIKTAVRGPWDVSVMTRIRDLIADYEKGGSNAK